MTGAIAKILLQLMQSKGGRKIIIIIVIIPIALIIMIVTILNQTFGMFGGDSKTDAELEAIKSGYSETDYNILTNLQDMFNNTKYHPDYDKIMNGEVPEGAIFITPIDGDYTITSEFGYREYSHNGQYVREVHSGIDLATGRNAKILVAYEGEVVSVNGIHWSYGNHVYIKHTKDDKTFYTLYAHMKDKPLVKVNDKVKAGKVLGREGATGNVTGPHLHFEVRIQNDFNSAINAVPYLFGKQDKWAGQTVSELKKLFGV